MREAQEKGRGVDVLGKRERGGMVSTFSHSVSAVIVIRVSNQGGRGNGDADVLWGEERGWGGFLHA